MTTKRKQILKALAVAGSQIVDDYELLGEEATNLDDLKKVADK